MNNRKPTSQPKSVSLFYSTFSSYRPDALDIKILESKRLIILHYPKEFIILRMRDLQPLKHVSIDFTLASMQILSDSTLLLFSKIGKITRKNLSGRIIDEFRPLKTHIETFLFARVLKSQKIIILCFLDTLRGSTLYFYTENYTLLFCIKPLLTSSTVRHLVCLDGDKTLIAGFDCGTITVCDLEKRAGSVKLHQHKAQIEAMEYSEKDKILVSCDQRGKVYIWSYSTGGLNPIMSFSQSNGLGRYVFKLRNYFFICQLEESLANVLNLDTLDMQVVEVCLKEWMTSEVILFGKEKHFLMNGSPLILGKIKHRNLRSLRKTKR